MILFIHQDGKKLLEIRKDSTRLEIESSKLSKEFFLIGKKYPEELIIWVDHQYLDKVQFEKLNFIFKHDLIMASFSVGNNPVTKDIGYIDQFPFANPFFQKTYATWFMSTDMGGIRGRTLNNFLSMFEKIDDFDFLLNSISKIGQQNSLLCYSEPALYLGSDSRKINKSEWSLKKLFRFVGSHYHKARLPLLFFSFLLNGRKFPLIPLLNGFLQKSYFKSDIILGFIRKDFVEQNYTKEVDVIIPTFKRPEMVKRLLDELNSQTLLPKKVILIEQVQSGADSMLNISAKDYQWDLEHVVTNKIGACHARNLGLDLAQSDFVFLCDDDNKLDTEVLQSLVNDMINYGLDVANTAYPQPGESLVFKKMKQWASFGSGNALLNRKKTGNIRFDPALEGGYGEDVDFGYQLRKNGNDIIYTPDVTIQHLKSEEGGFREFLKNQKDENIPNAPKPSPSMMVLLKKHYSEQMIFGYKLELFLRYYKMQKIWNPFKYIKIMRRRWSLSEVEADKLLKTYN